MRDGVSFLLIFMWFCNGRDKVMLVIVKAMKNPRSALCKTSVMASADIFKAFGDKLFESPISDAFENVVCIYP